MVTTKQLNIKNKTYYFYNDLISIKDFDPKLLKLDKKYFKNISMYYIGYVTTKDEYKINSVNLLYLLVEEKEGSKYLNILHSSNEVLKEYEEVWSGIKNCIHEIKSYAQGEYAKDYMKIKFSSDDALPQNKIQSILTIIIRSIFQEDGKYYPQVFLDECLYEI